MSCVGGVFSRAILLALLAMGNYGVAVGFVTFFAAGPYIELKPKVCVQGLPSLPRLDHALGRRVDGDIVGSVLQYPRALGLI